MVVVASGCEKLIPSSVWNFFPKKKVEMARGSLTSCHSEKQRRRSLKKKEDNDR